VWSKKLGNFDPFCGTCKVIAGRSVPRYWVDDNGKAQYFTAAPKNHSQLEYLSTPSKDTSLVKRCVDQDRPLGYDDSWVGFYNYLQNACGAGDDEHGLLEEAAVPRSLDKEDELY